MAVAPFVLFVAAALSPLSAGAAAAFGEGARTFDDHASLAAALRKGQERLDERGLRGLADAADGPQD